MQVETPVLCRDESGFFKYHYWATDELCRTRGWICAWFVTTYLRTNAVKIKLFFSDEPKHDWVAVELKQLYEGGGVRYRLPGATTFLFTFRAIGDWLRTHFKIHFKIDDVVTLYVKAVEVPNAS